MDNQQNTTTVNTAENPQEQEYRVLERTLNINLVPPSDNITNPEDIPQTDSLHLIDRSKDIDAQPLQEAPQLQKNESSEHSSSAEPSPEDIQDDLKTGGGVEQASSPVVMEGQVVEQKPKHPGGRPSKFNEAMLNRAKGYLKHSLQQKNLPLIEELARLCEVNDDTLYEWMEQSEEFSETIKRLKSLQKERIILKGFSAKNPTFSIFMLKANHGMMETEKQIITPDKNININITRE